MKLNPGGWLGEAPEARGAFLSVGGKSQFLIGSVSDCDPPGCSSGAVLGILIG